ncbi:MAG TPA: hypothetical protein VES95_03690 [Dermatophilaceae bacterium]|nr:hypothetical protein [Dermatophilaceae bacterium]
MSDLGQLDLDRMLEAHVRLELDRWTGGGLEGTVREQVDAVFGWLGGVRLADVVPAAETASALAAVADELPVTDELVTLVTEAVAAGHALLSGHEGTVGALVSEEEVEATLTLVVGMDDARREILDVVTTSQAYTELVAHVVYLGLKSYVLTENVLARKIPGASSLVRLGQRGLNSAAPKLEGNVDRQLTAFVQANISETLRDTRRYLDVTLDAERLRALGDDVWAALIGRTLGSLTSPVDSTDLQAFVARVGPVAAQVRDSGLLGDLVETGAVRVLERHADRPVAEVLAALGLEPERLAGDVVALLRPALDQAAATGFLEARVRASLEPFYAALPGLLEKSPTPGRARAATGSDVRTARKRAASTKSAAQKAGPTKAAPSKAAPSKAAPKKAATKAAAAKAAKKAAPAKGGAATRARKGG